MSCIDRYSKHFFLYSIPSKINFHGHLEEIITQTYPQRETIITDNEAIFCSHAANVIHERYGISHIKTPAQHSIANGQVERAHSTQYFPGRKE